MRLDYLPEGSDDAEHQQELEKTGYWGAQGAGVVFLARSTGRLCLQHRSPYVEQGGTWGVWGGAIDKGEDPETAAKREAQEEGGGGSLEEIVPLFVFKDGSFRYSNFLAVVADEFTPVPDEDSAWEMQGFQWCEFGEWPEPLHFGAEALFSDPQSVRTIRQYAPTDQPQRPSSQDQQDPGPQQY